MDQQKQQPTIKENAITPENIKERIIEPMASLILENPKMISFLDKRFLPTLERQQEIWESLVNGNGFSINKNFETGEGNVNLRVEKHEPGDLVIAGFNVVGSNLFMESINYACQLNFAVLISMLHFKKSPIVLSILGQVRNGIVLPYRILDAAELASPLAKNPILKNYRAFQSMLSESRKSEEKILDVNETLLEKPLSVGDKTDVVVNLTRNSGMYQSPDTNGLIEYLAFFYLSRSLEINLNDIQAELKINIMEEASERYKLLTNSKVIEKLKGVLAAALGIPLENFDVDEWIKNWRILHGETIESTDNKDEIKEG